MNKEELISEMSGVSGLSKEKTRKALNALINIATMALSRNEKILYRNAGTFSIIERAARIGRNPQTGMEIRIAKRKVVKFTANCPGPH